MESKWVLLHYFPHEPVQVYGRFRTEEEARAYAERQGFAIGGAYQPCEILDVEEE